MHGSWEEVAAGVWHGRYRPFDVGVAVVVGDTASLLVDTRGGPEQATELREDLAALALPPVTDVVNTHAHGDHCFGNAAFAEHAAVWAHHGCADALADGGQAQRDHLLQLLDAGGVAGGDAAIADDVASAAVVAPTRLVDALAEVDVGGRRVRLRFLGAGHTDHDVVVDVPDADAVVVGDLVEESGPPAFEHSDPLAWPEALDRLRALGRRVIVPGHGAAVGPLFVADQQADLAAIADLVGRVAQGTLTPEQAVRRAPLPEAAVRAALTRAVKP